MRKTYLYMTAVAMSAALAAGCQKAEPAETTAAERQWLSNRNRDGGE